LELCCRQFDETAVAVLDGVGLVLQTV